MFSLAVTFVVAIGLTSQATQAPPVTPPAPPQRPPVVMEVTIGPDGRVTDVKVLRPNATHGLDAAAIEAARNWAFLPGRSVPVKIAIPGQGGEVAAPAQMSAAEIDLRNRLLARPDDFNALLDLAKILRETNRRNEATATLERALDILRRERTLTSGEGTPTCVAVPAGGRLAPVRVGGDIPQPERTHYVVPTFPQGAAGLTGVVILEVIIDTQGNVAEARVLRPSPPFEQAAVDAVRQWKYAPTFLNGTAVPVVMTVTVAFSGR